MGTIREYNQNQFWFRLYDNTDKLRPEQIKAKTGCYGLVNLAYFALTDKPSLGIKAFDHESAIMIAGKWGKQPQWHEWGICIDREGRMTIGTEKDAVYDYAVGLPTVYIDGKAYTKNKVSRNGVTYTGLKADGTVVVLVAAKDHGMTSDEAVEAMRGAGCVHIFRWDGSWSSQGILDPNTTVKASQYRCCRSWLLIFEKNGEKEDKPMDKTGKVVLDPGHGVETAGKRSPDSTYLEHEFNLDMARRVKAHLERHGVSVTLTRTNEHDVSLADRVSISNAAKPDLFVSLHSNASGNGKDWTTPEGYGIYTSASGENAERNKAARAILARAKESWIHLWGGGLYHARYYVLVNTAAPAVLIEHGFHTNKAETEKLKSPEYRALLAQVDAKGILDYLGIAWVDEPATAPETPKESTLICPHCGGALKIEKG